MKKHPISLMLLASITITASVLSTKESEAEMPIIRPIGSASDIKLAINEKPSEIPLRIVVPARDINLAVVHSELENGTWVVPDHTAGFAEGSSYIDEPHGNTIIFAHARNGMFRNLLNTQIGDSITVMGHENVYTYRVHSIDKILPDEIDKVMSIGGEHLTLFTCEGINDQYRLLVKATRINVSSYSESDLTADKNGDI